LTWISFHKKNFIIYKILVCSIVNRHTTSFTKLLHIWRKNKEPLHELELVIAIPTFIFSLLKNYLMKVFSLMFCKSSSFKDAHLFFLALYHLIIDKASQMQKPQRTLPSYMMSTFVKSSAFVVWPWPDGCPLPPANSMVLYWRNIMHKIIYPLLQTLNSSRWWLAKQQKTADLATMPKVIATKTKTRLSQ
jgi:hypothetical protein